MRGMLLNSSTKNSCSIIFNIEQSDILSRSFNIIETHGLSAHAHSDYKEIFFFSLSHLVNTSCVSS